ncbi:MAG: nucleoside monophosphate kinase [Phycisphaerales bacterium]|nr:nucleoside monophosphate kinase [Phycisphaerales bacterium]
MANARFNAVLLFGGPGCGKGTQGAALAGLPNIRHLAMGDIFRALDKQSDIGREFLSYSTKGLLVPDELTVRVWKAHIEAMVKDGRVRRDYHTLLLDGIPRTTQQVGLMKPHVDVVKIVYLVVPDQNVLIQRLKGRALKGNRPDDADEKVIRERLRVYDESTAPVLDGYDKSLVARINADQSPFAVLRDIADCLSRCVSGDI